MRNPSYITEFRALVKAGLWGMLVVLGAACSQVANSSADGIPRQVDFNYHVRPILSDRCYTCHGPDENSREADLRLDRQADALAARGEKQDRYAIVPGHPEQSEMIRRITSSDPDEVMPPPESHLSLDSREVEILRQWIAQGANWKIHWAFDPPQKSRLPEALAEPWVRDELDYFVWARMQEQGLSPNETASRGKRLRRASFDLTGLPPDEASLQAFLNDESDDAWEQAVDKLLASPAYGERMASLWLDAARYADSHGYQDDRPRTMWPWRDWVVEAFNQNMPYDSFLIWQLAGDLLPHSTYQHKLATGFNRNHGITQEGGVVAEEYITEYVADRTNTFSTAMLGLTLECARCHDHKYDPFSQKEYYQLFAFFNRLDEQGQINYFDEAPVPRMRMEDAETEVLIQWLDTTITQSTEALARQMESPAPDFAATWAHLQHEVSAEQEAAKGLLVHLPLDTWSGMQSPNRSHPEQAAQANTGLQRSLDPPIPVPGKIGQGLAFDGHNFLNLGDAADFQWYDPFTLALWVNPGEANVKAVSLLGKRNGEQKREGYECLLMPDRTLQASLIYNHWGARITLQTKEAIPLKTWSHLAFVYDGSGMARGVQLFLNGKNLPVRVLADSLQRKSIWNGNDLIAGHWTPRNLTSNDFQGFAGGSLDEIRVYDRSLSPWEIKSLAGISQSVAADAWPWYLREKDPDYQARFRRLDSFRRAYREIPHVMIMADSDTPRTTHVLVRGAYDAPGDVVDPGTPASILPFPDSLARNRLGLARWLTMPQHPLTARVMVNRCWQMLFGRGLVKTQEDFGSQGSLPSHPKLLDALAVDFMASGWDVKALMKRLVLSATYQQSSRIDHETYQLDPENIWLSRGPNQRLSAEMVRDQALALSGYLNPQIGGPWVKPYQPPGIWKALANQIGENKYRPSRGKNRFRRSLYSYWKRTIPPPMMLTFDAPERTVCVVKRQYTQTPLQALVLLNDPQFLEASQGLALRMMRLEGSSLEDRLRQGFFWCTSRWPTRGEVTELEGIWSESKADFEVQTVPELQAFLQMGYQAMPSHINPVDLAAFTVLANALLNLDETLKKS